MIWQKKIQLKIKDSWKIRSSANHTEIHLVTLNGLKRYWEGRTMSANCSNEWEELWNSWLLRAETSTCKRQAKMLIMFQWLFELITKLPQWDYLKRQVTQCFQNLQNLKLKCLLKSKVWTNSQRTNCTTCEMRKWIWKFDQKLQSCQELIPKEPGNSVSHFVFDWSFKIFLEIEFLQKYKSLFLMFCFNGFGSKFWNGPC